MDPETPPSRPAITLRPFRTTDVDDCLVWVGDDRVTQFTRWDTFTSRDQALDFLEHTAIPAPWHRAVCTGNDRPVGSIYVRQGTGNERCRGELGYAFAPEYWGRGIATAAVGMVMSVVFDELPQLERVEGLVDAENLASQRVLEKAGFLKEGVLRKYVFLKGETRDIVMYSIVSTDPIVAKKDTNTEITL